MNKGSFADDTFEKAIEAGQTMAKAGAKQIKQTFDPRKILENALGTGGEDKVQKQMKEAKDKNPNMTPLDFAKLQDKYNKQDSSKTDALRNRLFQMVKSGDEKVMQEMKQKKQEKLQRDAYQEQEKKKHEQKKLRQSQSSAAPQGKERKSIFGAKKKKGIQPSPTELKPSTGKQ